MNDQNLDLFLKILKRAINSVQPEYLHTVYGEVRVVIDLIQNAAQRRNIENFMVGNDLIRTGERIFCYELYHQLRMLMSEYPAQFNGVFLQGELRKHQIYPLLETMDLTPLSGNFIPDFLLHSPATADDHPYVIEVKADRFLSYPQIYGDISKIAEFINNYHYQRGVFITININFDFLKQSFRDCFLLHDIPHIIDIAPNIYILNRENEHCETSSFRLDEIIIV